MSAIEARGLSKVYRSGLGGRRVEALTGIDLRVEPGEIFGLLGPNGAGKTTAVKILLGLTRATGGEASLFGIPAGNPSSRRRVGYLPEGHRFPGYLTARQTLSIFGRMSGVRPEDLRNRIPSLLARVRLSEWADVRVKKFSKGMTQRLGLAAALVHEPDALLLDEPTDGVDPVGRREIRDLLQEEAGRGRAILLNSHLLSEVELLCGRVAVLRQGSVAAQGRIEDLTAVTSRYKLVASGVDDALLTDLRATGALVDRVNGHFDLTARDIAHLNAVVDRLRAGGGQLEELTPVRSSLEDVFVGLVAPSREGKDWETGRLGDKEIARSGFSQSPSLPVPPSADDQQDVPNRKEDIEA
jgi:ABC-2 type transport system ATP-binding protein